MKLLLLDQFSDLGGAQQVLLDLLPAIRARGWSATVGLPGDGPMFARVRERGLDVARIDCGPYRSGLKSLGDMARFAVSTPRLARQIRRLASVDLIYVNGPRLLPAVALARPAAPVVFHAHSYLPPGAMRRLAGESLRLAGAHVVALCEFVASTWREFVGERVRVIYNGVAGPSAAQRPRAGPKTVGCIGRIAPEKGQMEFVEAAARIHRQLPGCRFVVYGAPLLADPRYADAVRAAAQGQPVEFAGWAENVYDALANIDLLLVPSAAHEATTRVILEAFAAGVPVIAFRAGGIPEVVDHGRTGFLSDSIGEMAQLSVDLLCNPDRLAAISAAAQESWERRFTVQRFHEELLGLLESRRKNSGPL